MTDEAEKKSLLERGRPSIFKPNGIAEGWAEMPVGQMRARACVHAGSRHASMRACWHACMLAGGHATRQGHRQQREKERIDGACKAFGR